MQPISYRTGVILVLVAATLWSSMGLMIRALGDMGTWQVLFWRSAGMLPVVIAYVTWRSNGALFARIRTAGLPATLGGLGLVAAFSGAIYAIQSTTVANAVFLFAAAPVMTALLGWILLGETVLLRTWIAIAVALLGMLIMVREGLAAGALSGNIAALLSALGFAAFTVALRRGKTGDMMPAIILGGVFSMIVAAIVIASRGEALLPSAGQAGLAAAMGAVILGLGLSFYTLGSRAVEAANLALLSLLEVILAPIWVWFFLGETASIMTFVGGVIVLAAVTLNALAGIGGRKAASQPGAIL